MFLPAPKIALGIKTVEYLAAGLPLVVNTKSSGAAEIVERYGVGLVVDDERSVDQEALRRLADKKQEVSAACRKLAETRFSTSVVANRYLQLYSRLTE
jgi:glycosyltransferase involved in cell wall biosynthesis